MVMRIDSVNNNMNNANSVHNANGVRMGMQTRMTQGMDSYSKNIQNQIQTKQQQSKGSSMDDMLGGKRQAQKKSQNGHERNSPKVSLLSQASMTA